MSLVQFSNLQQQQQKQKALDCDNRRTRTHQDHWGGQLLAASTTLNTEYYTPSFDERMCTQQATSIRHNYMRATEHGK
jgi:hypothetical protein